MKKTIITLILALSVQSLYAFTKTSEVNGVVGSLVDNDGVGYDMTGDVSPAAYDMNKLSSAITYSSVTFSNVVFSTNAFTAGSASITKANHGLQTSADVKLEQTAGTVPGPLVAETTYYAIRVDANTIKLATTAAQAVANDPIIILSSTTDGSTQTYTLVPLALAGSPVFTYQATVDGTNWFNLGVSSTIAGYSGVHTWFYDFDDFNYSAIRLAITAPTAGCIDVKAMLRMKK